MRPHPAQNRFSGASRAGLSADRRDIWSFASQRLDHAGSGVAAICTFVAPAGVQEIRWFRRAVHLGKRSWRVIDDAPDKGVSVIVLGVVLLIIGFVAKIQIVWTLGIVAIVVGAILLIAGSVGHQVGGRRHYY